MNRSPVPLWQAMHRPSPLLDGENDRVDPSLTTPAYLAAEKRLRYSAGVILACFWKAR